MSFSKQVAQMANHVKRSGGWIMKQALSAGIDQEEKCGSTIRELQRGFWWMRVAEIE
jgi:predicted transcriptional regulator